MEHHTDTTDPESQAAPRPGPFARVARGVAAHFGFGTTPLPDTPFRDSDFEADSSFFGRPLGDH